MLAEQFAGLLESAGMEPLGEWLHSEFGQHFVATLHLALSAVLAGVGVHEVRAGLPLMRRVPHERFAACMEEQVRRAGWVIFPLFALATLLMGLLYALLGTNVALAGLLVAGVAWGLTLGMLWPAQRRLCEGFREEGFERMARGMKIRMFLWCGHAGLAWWLLVSMQWQ